EGGRAAVERVDHHLAIGRAGDLDAAVEHVLRLRRHHPVTLADRLRLRQEIGQLALVKLALPSGARREQLLAAGLELAMQFGYETQRFRAENLGERLRYRAGNGDTLRKRGGHVHRSILLRECGSAT